MSYEWKEAVDTEGFFIFYCVCSIYLAERDGFLSINENGIYLKTWQSSFLL